MKLLLLFGDAAVGKMTVGQELMKITDLRLFHNHMTIEPVLEVFGSFQSKTIDRLRQVIFEDFARTDNYGLIFTFMWAFNQQADWDYVQRVREIFEHQGAEIYYVELVAPQEIRLQRNVTENRLKNKASKRDLERSTQRILADDERYRCVSLDGEIPFDNYLKIDNSHLTAAEVAEMIKMHFGL
jgi:hypothetical protein